MHSMHDSEAHVALMMETCPCMGALGLVSVSTGLLVL